MVWYFGNHAGVDFNSGEPVVLSNSQMMAEAGCSGICDLQGRLLFYTNGNKVWNKNHQVMVNGDNLNGSQRLNQNSVVVPLPSSTSLYYLFTIVDAGVMNLFQYSVIDMTLNNGQGELTQKNIPIADDVVEKVAAVQHCNGQDYWVITHGNDTAFYSYRVTAAGIDPSPVISASGARPLAPIGYLKVSPAGNKIAMPINDQSRNLLMEVSKFDNRTGDISQPQKIFSNSDNTYCYGVEFSPDGNLLYFSTGGLDYGLWQYDLRSENEQQLNQSAVKIGSGNNYALQLAPDGIIYIASENRPWLNAINQPDFVGDACDYQQKKVEFSGDTSLMGLPNFVQSWFYQPAFEVVSPCAPDSSFFLFHHAESMDSIRWKFGDGSAAQWQNMIDNGVSHGYMHPGLYEVEARAYHCGVEELMNQQVEVFALPESTLVSDTVICPGCTLLLDAGSGFDSYLWNTGSAEQFIDIYVPGTYSVEISLNGCFNTSLVNVLDTKSVIWAPDAFTPNGDGLNDVFVLVSNMQMEEFTLWVVDRGGTIVFISHDINMGWDGQFQGKLLPMQTYVWYAQFSFSGGSGSNVRQSAKGTVLLLR